MELFGVDVIIDCDTKKYAVIDINAFPGSNLWQVHGCKIKKMFNESKYNFKSLKD